MSEKTILKALRGETQEKPPVWMMRQAGRYLPEYRATRAQAGDFLSLCYNPDLATEVTLQPIRRYGFDAAILFADILLLPQALGVDLWFETGEGPRMSTTTSVADLDGLKPIAEVDETLSPIYQTVRNLAGALPETTTLIGFAGAPWTVATYMVAGRGTIDKKPAFDLIAQDQSVFDRLIDILVEGTVHYLCAQIKAGAEVVKLFDSWAGSLQGDLFERYSIQPNKRIAERLKLQFPNTPIIAFPRGGTNEDLTKFVDQVPVDCVAIGAEVDRGWARGALQSRLCIQGNLDQSLLVTGGDELLAEAKAVVEDFKGGPHIFNLGHGITPDANPDNVLVMLEAISEASA